MLWRTITSILRHRELVWELAWRELRGQHRGALLGSTWLLLGPLVQVLAYVGIVAFVFGRRAGSPLDYAVYVLAGMLPWQILLRCLGEAPGLIRERLDLVKQVIYPLETLPWTSVAVSACGALASLAVYLALAAARGTLPASALLLPLPAALLLLFVVGCAWTLSVAGVLIKDLREVVTVGLSLLVYASPVVLSEQLVSPEVWAVVRWNPLAHPVICFRDVLQGAWHPESWAVFVVLALGAFLSGAWVMTRARQHVAEYL